MNIHGLPKKVILDVSQDTTFEYDVDVDHGNGFITAHTLTDERAALDVADRTIYYFENSGVRPKAIRIVERLIVRKVVLTETHKRTFHE